jgi:hypothetical protein
MRTYKPEFKKYNISWLVNFLQTRAGNVNFGVCMKDNRIAFMEPAENVMKPFIVRDVYIEDNGTCADSNYCLNYQCEHNRNTPEQYREALKLDDLDLPDGWDSLQRNIEQINQEIKQEQVVLDESKILYFEQPPIRWVKAAG